MAGKENPKWGHKIAAGVEASAGIGLLALSGLNPITIIGALLIEIDAYNRWKKKNK